MASRPPITIGLTYQGLGRLGLMVSGIDTDELEEVVEARGWFYKKNQPDTTTKSRGKGIFKLSIIDEIPPNNFIVLPMPSSDESILAIGRIGLSADSRYGPKSPFTLEELEGILDTLEQQYEIQYADNIPDREAFLKHYQFLRETLPWLQDAINHCDVVYNSAHSDLLAMKWAVEKIGYEYNISKYDTVLGHCRQQQMLVLCTKPIPALVDEIQQSYDGSGLLDLACKARIDQILADDNFIIFLQNQNSVSDIDLTLSSCKSPSIIDSFTKLADAGLLDGKNFILSGDEDWYQAYESELSEIPGLNLTVEPERKLDYITERHEMRPLPGEQIRIFRDLYQEHTNVKRLRESINKAIVNGMFGGKKSSGGSSDNDEAMDVDVRPPS